jgi:hypothetical protein
METSCYTDNLLKARAPAHGRRVIKVGRARVQLALGRVAEGGFVEFVPGAAHQSVACSRALGLRCHDKQGLVGSQSAC